jgi:hypothetical protein
MRAFVLALAALAGASFIGPALAVDTVDHFNVQEPRPPLYRETPPSGSFKLPPVAPPPQTAPDGASAKQRLRWVVFATRARARYNCYVYPFILSLSP